LLNNDIYGVIIFKKVRFKARSLGFVDSHVSLIESRYLCWLSGAGHMDISLARYQLGHFSIGMGIPIMGKSFMFIICYV
jgi:predicted aspartyl protease